MRIRFCTLLIGFCLFAVSCSPIDIPNNGVVVEKQGLAESATPTASAIFTPEIIEKTSKFKTITPEKTPKPTKIPFSYLSRKGAADPFFPISFAIDPKQNGFPRLGVIYTSIPDGAIVKLWLRYVDQNQEKQGQIIYETVKDGVVGFLFELSSQIPRQKMTLEISMRTDDPEHPQTEQILSLYGKEGEFLTGENAEERKWGGKFLRGSWEIDWPFQENAKLDPHDVVISSSGAKYHKETCRYASVEGKRINISLSKLLGYEPCKICKP